MIPNLDEVRKASGWLSNLAYGSQNDKELYMAIRKAWRSVDLIRGRNVAVDGTWVLIAAYRYWQRKEANTIECQSFAKPTPWRWESCKRS